MLISSYFITGFTLAFNNHPAKHNQKVEIILDFMQILDMCLSLVTTFDGVNGVVVEKPLPIIKDYLKSTFAFDCLGCLPNLFYLEKNPDIYALKVFRYI